MKHFCVAAILLLLLSYSGMAAELPSATATLYLEMKGSYSIESMGTDISISTLGADGVLVADGSRSRFWRITPSSGIVESFAGAALEKRFMYPKAMCQDNSGSIWIASPYTSEVVQLSGDGSYSQSFGTAELNLGKPVDVSCSEPNTVFILDSERKAIIRLVTAKHEATIIPLKNITQAISVQRMAVTKGGGAYFLLDPDHQKAYRVQPDGQSSELPLSAATEGSYDKFEGIGLGPYGLLFLTDSQSHSILTFAADGKLQQKFPLVERLLRRPTSLAFCENDLWLVDEGKKAVLHFLVRTASTGLEHALLGEEYLAANFPPEAAKQFETASLLGYESAEMRLYWGQARYALSDFNRALVQFQRAADLNPAIADVFLWKGHTHIALGMTEDALKDYQRVITMVPDHGLAHYNLGMTYLNLGQLSLAETHLKRSVELDSNDQLARLGLGRLYLAQKKYDEARDLFSSFSGSDSPARQARYYLGLLCLEEGKAREALSYLEQASQEGPFFSDSFYAMGNAHRVLGDKAKAENSYRKALEINSNNTQAAKALQEIKQQ